MLPDRVSNPEPLTCESGALPIALRGPAFLVYTQRLFSFLVRLVPADKAANNVVFPIAYALQISYPHCALTRLSRLSKTR